MTGLFYPFEDNDTVSVYLHINTLATSNRFKVHFSPPTSLNFTPVTCYGLNNGTVVVKKPGITDWECVITNDSNIIVHSAFIINESDTIKGLGIGNYYVKTLSNSTLYDTTSFTIIQSNQIIVEYEVNSFGENITPNVAIVFQNNSDGATSYNWNFGDGSSPSIEESPIYQYANEGTYNVTLSATNLDCMVSFSDSIVVSPVLTGITASVAQEKIIFNVYQQQEKLVINIDVPKSGQMMVSVLNMLGVEVCKITKLNSNSINESIVLPISGNYFVNLYADNKHLNKNIIYIK